jgi:hypothetical protein
LGRIIPLYRVEREATSSNTQTLDHVQHNASHKGSSVVRTGPAAPETNCHGWVFTEGRYLIDGEVIDDILNDNGYVPVSTPKAGDLIVYRGPDGMVAHTGLVRVVSSSDPILVESQWGSQGRFRHSPEDQPYWESWGFYHSERQGHRLTGIGENPSPGSNVVATAR